MIKDTKVKPALTEIRLGPDGFGSVVVGGQDISNVVAGVELRSHAGSQTRLDLIVDDIDISVHGAAPRVLVGGQEFTWDDVDTLRDLRVNDIADRIAALLPPREE